MDDRRRSFEPFPPRAAERPVGGLLSDLARQMSLLIRQEIALLKAELRDKVGQVGTGAVLAPGGGIVAFAGFLYVLAAAMFGLGKILDMWLAALVVGVVVILIGGVLVIVGRSRLQAE